MKKRQITHEEIAAHTETIRINKIIRSLTLQVKNSCVKNGLRQAEMQLKFIEDHSTTILPTELDWQTTIKCFKNGIDQFKETLE